MLLLSFSLILSSMFLDGNQYKLLDLTHSDQGVLIARGNLVSSTNPMEWHIKKTADEGDSILILEIDTPAIETAAYALQGEIKYEVEQSGYLELIHSFGEKGSFFTRSMNEKGPMGMLKVKSDWRPFILPFYRNNEGSLDQIEIPPPEKLSLRVHLPGSAELVFRNIALVNLKEHPDLSFVAGQWFSSKESGLYFGSVGAVLGVIYGLMSFFCARGRYRAMVSGGLLSMGLLGFLALAFAFSAAFLEQPGHVTWPFFLLGFLLLAFLLLFRPIFRRRFQASELRKMESKDF